MCQWKSQQRFRWEILQEIKDLQKVSGSVQKDAWGVGYNVTRYKEIPKDPKPGDVGRAKETLNRLVSYSQRIQAIKEKLDKRRQSLFKSDHVCYSWAEDELCFIDDHLRITQGLHDVISKLENGIRNTISLLKKKGFHE